jgi:hypothetical protein
MMRLKVTFNKSVRLQLIASKEIYHCKQWYYLQVFDIARIACNIIVKIYYGRLNDLDSAINDA